MKHITRNRKFKEERNCTYTYSNSGVKHLVKCNIKCPIFKMQRKYSSKLITNVLGNNKLCSRNFIN